MKALSTKVRTWKKPPSVCGACSLDKRDGHTPYCDLTGKTYSDKLRRTECVNLKVK